MKKDQKLIDIVCAIAFVTGFVLTVTDGCMNFFGLSQGAQYLSNFIYMCLVLPACIGCSSFPQWMRPDLFSKEAEKTEDEPCRQ